VRELATLEGRDPARSADILPASFWTYSRDALPRFRADLPIGPGTFVGLG
jgi:hypothetical protein